MGSKRKAPEVPTGNAVELRVPFMVVKKSKSQKPGRGVHRYYFQVPSRYRKQGCDVKSGPLGDHLEKATATAEILYAGFERWKQNRDVIYVENKVRFGTFDWLVQEYVKTAHFLARREKTRSCYVSDLNVFSRAIFKSGQLAGMRLGDVELKDLTRVRVSCLIDDLHVTKLLDWNGIQREVRCGGRACDLVSTACTMWNHMAVKIEYSPLANNPFEKHRIEQYSEKHLAARHEELQAVVESADQLDLSVVGTIVLCCFEFPWRPQHVVELMRVEHYRPQHYPDSILISDTKNEQQVWRPLVSLDGKEMYPQIMERLAKLKGDRVKGLMFNQGQISTKSCEGPDQKIKMHWLNRQIRKICAHAGVRDLTMTTYRHGGITEMAEARLSPNQMMARSGHKDPRTLNGYIQRTDVLQEGARLDVLAHREMRKTAKARRARTTKVEAEHQGTSDGWSYGRQPSLGRTDVNVTWSYGASLTMKTT